ncbi:hypothetical protein D9611_005174 [Ephemerocybe angulata]|uniref:Uncharacterized protein n=1 Tax=Ephemerocybe angulata TaxID=980116 RepID=A0A8H5C0L6_9AGAR|nr:hypothetical protein D9611_005174 [Tulosesus angulatus]
MSQQESTNANPSGNTFSESKHEISRLERDCYYFGVSGRRPGPKLVYRTSTDVFRNRVVVGQFTYICEMQLLPVYGHDKLSKLWNTILEETVKLLDKREIKFTSIDLARFRWSEEDRVPTTNTVTSRITIWIGVLPGSTTTEAAFHSSQGILELLKQHEIDDLDVAFRESVVRSLVMSDQRLEAIFYQNLRCSSELFAPEYEPHHDQNVIDWATTSLSLPIAGRKTLHIQGSLGFYFRVGSDLYGVTARHVLFPQEEGNMPYKHVAPAPEREVVLMSERAYEDFLTSIRNRERDLAVTVEYEQRRATTQRAQAETGDERAAIALESIEAEIERKNKAIEALDAFRAKIRDFRWSWDVDMRVIGHVVWAPPISGNNPPYGYTQDLCVIKLDKSKFAANFRGNVIDLCHGRNLERTIDFWWRIHPRHGAPSNFELPLDYLYKLQRVLTPAQLKQPNTQDSNGDPVRFVFQKGHTSGLTIGPLNGFESHVRRYSLLGSFDSIEAAVYAYDTKSGPFSQCGDSGAVIAGDEQEFGLQLTSGAGSGNIELTDITYCTPMFWLWNHVIKPEFPGAELYFDAI